jgi:hypothetical protein
MVSKQMRNLTERITYYLISVLQGPSLTGNENAEISETQIRKWLTDYHIFDAETSDFEKNADLEVEKKERKDQRYKRKNKSSCIDVYIIM